MKKKERENGVARLSDRHGAEKLKGEVAHGTL